MDKEILNILKQIQATQQEHTEELKSINSKLGVTYDELARTREDVTDIKESIDKLKQNVDFVESATIKNLVDIREIKNSKSKHSI